MAIRVDTTNYNYVGMGPQSDGNKIGYSALETVGFFGATPVVRQTKASAVTGASDSSALSAAITAISLTLTNLGLTN
jgi:hypothetical protein